MEQIKKDPTDPDFESLNPEIVKMAKTNGFIRQPLELYLVGQLTWHEALEMMVTMLYGQFKDTQKLCTEILSEQPTHALLLSGYSGPLIKALPREAFKHEEETIPSLQESREDSSSRV